MLAPSLVVPSKPAPPEPPCGFSRASSTLLIWIAVQVQVRVRNVYLGKSGASRDPDPATVKLRSEKMFMFGCWGEVLEGDRITNWPDGVKGRVVFVVLEADEDGVVEERGVSG